MALAADQVEYGINVRNPYDLLNSDDEELDPTALIEAAKQQGKVEAERAAAAKKAEKKRTGALPPPVKEPPPPVKEAGTPGTRGGKENRPRGRGGLRGEGRPPRAARGGRGGAAEGGPTNLPPRLAGQNGGFGGQWEEDRFGERGRGGRGRGVPRGRGAARGAPGAEGGRGGASFGGGFGGGGGGGGGFGGGFGGEGTEEVKPVVEGEDFGGRGGFRGRGGRGGRGRQFDRKSGSDQTGSRAGAEKRGGHGRGNWGTAEDELVGETETLNTSGNLSDPPVEDRKEDGEKNEDEGEKVEEVKELTLDEWRAQQAQKAKPAFNVRKAGEGEKNKDWDKLVPLAKEPAHQDESDEYIIEEKQSKKKTVPIDIKFSVDAGSRGGFEGRGRGGRGGRGGERGRGGGRGRGAPPSGPPPAAPYNTNYASPRGAPGGRGGGRSAEFHMDSSMFPELGAQ